jgi:hypothetical protein
MLTVGLCGTAGSIAYADSLIIDDRLYGEWVNNPW